MDTQTIQKVLSHITKLYEKQFEEKLFHYVGPCDTLPKSIPKNKNSVYIINTDPSTKSGTHWLCLWISKRKQFSYFFDSYGRPPIFNKYIQNFIETHCKIIHWNVKQIQAYNSFVCGEYCCLFAACLSNKKHPKCFFKQFENSYKQNDKLAKILFWCLFKKTKQVRLCKTLKCIQNCKSFTQCSNK